MSSTKAGCPACGGTAFENLGEKNGFEMHQCSRCRTLAAVGDYSANTSLYEEIYAKPAPLTSGAQAGLRRILQHVEPWRGSGRMLDYGFGAGDLMREARALGWTVSGIEYSDNARTHAKSEGFDVVKTAAGLPRQTYDVVMMIEVLEHLPSAQTALREAFDLLRPGGALYATTPNARGLNPRVLGLQWSVVGPPDHRVLFSRSGLRTLAAGVGLGVRSIRTEGLNPSEWRSRTPGVEGQVHGPISSAELNDRVESRPWLRVAKRAANSVLSVTGLGDTLKMLATR